MHLPLDVGWFINIDSGHSSSSRMYSVASLFTYNKNRQRNNTKRINWIWEYGHATNTLDKQLLWLSYSLVLNNSAADRFCPDRIWPAFLWRPPVHSRVSTATTFCTAHLGTGFRRIFSVCHLQKKRSRQ